ncbi:hypothetical protein PVAP13_9NG359914 [Panicum virgatum]|uniref:Uncharacterized protein n=1 Tax=Panicum virgatum TaxID=38727 RepID=A0A8T0MQ18_PANVG|nr:hypothetical protein PVAP13_9NG359914 [Panicum virgatum]
MNSPSPLPGEPAVGVYRQAYSGIPLAVRFSRYPGPDTSSPPRPRSGRLRPVASSPRGRPSPPPPVPVRLLPARSYLPAATRAARLPVSRSFPGCELHPPTTDMWGPGAH